MHSYRIDDPRDALQRARMKDIIRFAREKNINEIDPEMPAMLARPIIRGKGLAGAFAAWARANVHFAPLGSAPQRPAVTSDQAAAVDAEADLAAQWAANRKQDLDTGRTKRPERHNPMNELRAEAKKLGIKIDRRDNVERLRAKVEAHGKDATQRH